MTMRDNWVPDTLALYADYLSTLREKRIETKNSGKTSIEKRKRISKHNRESILKKTNNRCHICGGLVEKEWQADHVLAHSGGGQHELDNYLPAHKVCNNYRWDYLAEEFQEILRLGVWLRTQIERKTSMGIQAGDQFVKSEKRRIARRRKS